jgi:hypothetical protein
MTRPIGITVPHRERNYKEKKEWEVQKPWVGLTDEDIKLLDLENYKYVVRIVEKKLKELNT